MRLAAAGPAAVPAPLRRREPRDQPTASIRRLLNAALAHTGLTDPTDGEPLHYTPHDFRSIFITDAILNGLPPHIAQVIAGHRDINVTMGYKAVYPDEAIQAHLAFLARRRACGPARNTAPPPTRNGRSSSATSNAARSPPAPAAARSAPPASTSTPASAARMLWPDPAQRHRLVEIRDNLIARIAEAEREGWLGEVEGLKISLAGADDKLAQIDRRSHDSPVDLGMPALTPRP